MYLPINMSADDCRMEPENLQELLVDYKAAKKKLFQYVFGALNYANDPKANLSLAERDEIRDAAEQRIQWFERSERREFVIVKEDLDKELVLFEESVIAVRRDLTRNFPFNSPGPIARWAQ